MFTRKLSSFLYGYKNLASLKVQKATSRQILASSAVLISSFIHGCKDGYLQTAVPLFMSEDSPFEVAGTYIPWIASISFSGTILAVTCRYLLGDRVSRKSFIQGCALITVVSWFFIFITTSAVVIVSCLFLYGAVANACNIIGQVYMGEVASPKNRELLGILFILLYAVGMQVETSLAVLKNYDILTCFPFLVAIINVVLAIFMIKSPCYLMMNGEEDEAFKNLCWLNDRPTTQTSSFLTQELSDMKNYVNEQRNSKMKDLTIILQPDNLKLMAVMGVIDAAVFISCDMVLCAYGALMVRPFNAVISGTWFSNVRNAFVLFGSILSYFTLRKFNRRSTLLFGFIASTIIHAALAICYSIEERYDNKIVSLIFVICFLLFGLVAVCTPICETAICILKMEVFPYRMKELYISVLEIVGNGACFLVVKFYIAMNERLGMFTLLMFYSMVSALAAILIGQFICNTKGKSLYEVRTDITAE